MQVRFLPVPSNSVNMEIVKLSLSVLEPNTGAEVPYTRCIEHNYFAPNNFYEELVKSYEYPADFKEGAEPYYPIINQENKRLYSMYSELAKATPNIHFGGRLGLFQYMDMDDAIEAALKMANRILLDESLTR